MIAAHRTRLRIRAADKVDLALAAGFGVVAEVELRVSSPNVLPGTVGLAVDSVLVLGPIAPLAWRRTAPVASVAAVAAALTLVGAALHGTVLFFGGLFPLLVALYSAAAYARTPWDRLVLLAPVLVVGPMPLYASNFDVPGDYLFAGVAALFTWVSGRGVRRWRRQSHALSEALAALEIGRETQTRLAVAQERARIARELHDVVAHSMSVMVLQATAARLDHQTDPAATDRALHVIEHAGRQSLVEMRRLLGVLRSQDEPPTGPPPGMAALPDLVADFRRAGLDVHTQVCGRQRPLPQAIDVSAYRIVQEALTNALRHGAARYACVQVRYLPHQLTLLITNPIADPPAPASTAGHGLIGIRERATLFDGTSRAESDGQGQFVLEVALPIPSVQS